MSCWYCAPCAFFFFFKQKTAYEMRISDWSSDVCSSDLQFNAVNAQRKRGIAITPVKFGISFNKTEYNQAGALVHIYTDGSVQLNHGGTEMGQRSEEHTSELQSLMRISYAVFCLKKKTTIIYTTHYQTTYISPIDQSDKHTSD